MACEQDYWNQMYANACDQSAPALLWRPRLFIDGNQWCALYGDNLQDGVAGFGASPQDAMWDFDKAWSRKLTPSNAKLTGDPQLHRGASSEQSERG